jgi:hypothetical protein
MHDDHRMSRVSSEHPEARLNRWAGMDVYRTEVDDLLSRFRGMPAITRRKGLFLALSLLGSKFARLEKQRVAGVKAVVALLPESLANMGGWLNRRDRMAREVQFSLFCFIDIVCRAEPLRSYEEQVLNLVATYLREVPSDAAQAAWMAGDLLGSHWNADRSLPVLLSRTRDARFVAGRCAALHGLGQLLEAGSIPSRRRAHVLAHIRQVASHDRSERVRSAASVTLSRVRT